MTPGVEFWALAVSCAISVVLSARWSKHATLGKLVFVVYAASNAISSCVCTLLLLEVLNPVELVYRTNLWRFFSLACLGTLVLALPAVQVVQIFISPFKAGSTRQRPKYGAAFITFVGYLSMVLCAAQNFPGGEDGKGWQGITRNLQTAVSSLGLIMMAGICGFSSISAMYTAFFQGKPQGLEATLQRLQVSVSNTDSLIQEQELQISRMQMEYARRGVASAPPSPETPTGNNFLNKFVPRITKIFRNSDSAALQEAEAEQAALRQFRSELAAELDSVKVKVEEERFAQTAQGKLWSAVFAVFAVYCLYRVATGYVRLGWYLFEGSLNTKKAPPKDAVVMEIAELVSYYQPNLSPDGWARVLGLLVSVCIIVTSVRGARNTASLLIKKLRKSHTSELVKLDPVSAAGVYSIYTLAIGTALQLNIPRSIASGLRTTVESGLTVESVQLLNDAVLCAASTATIVLLVLTAYLNTDRVDDIECAYEKYD